MSPRPDGRGAFFVREIPGAIEPMGKCGWIHSCVLCEFDWRVNDLAFSFDDVLREPEPSFYGRIGQHRGIEERGVGCADVANLAAQPVGFVDADYGVVLAEIAQIHDSIIHR